MQKPHHGLGGILSSPTARGAVYALLAIFVWSFNFIAGRALVGDIPPCTLALLRWTTAFCIILPFALPELKREWRYFTQHKWYYLVTGAIGVAFFNTALYIAAYEVAALNMALIFLSAPLFTIILSRICFGELISPGRVAGILITLTGVLALISRGAWQVLASLSLQPMDLLVLLAAFGFALYAILVRKKPQGGGQRSFFAVIFGIGVILLLPFSAWELAGGATVRLSPALYISVLYMGLGASIVSFWCWSKAIGLIGPARAAVIYCTIPLFTAVEAVLILGEPVLPVHYLGGALVIGGQLLAIRQPKQAAAQIP